MDYRVDQIRLPLDYSEKKLSQTIARLCQIVPHRITKITILGRSVDARQGLQYVLSARVSVEGNLKAHLKNIIPLAPLPPLEPLPHVGKQHYAPLVVGAGPAGLSAAWLMAKAGLCPILIDRGEEAFDRQRTVNAYWKKGILNEESNVLFGEGGAGLFSDGKLTSRSKERGYVRDFLDMLVHFGASENILIDTHPHIGTDKLLKLVPRLREEIIALGGQVLFNHRLDEILVTDGAVVGAIVNGRRIETDTMLLAIGHSARDTYKMLADKKVEMGIKPTAIGVRVELPQRFIDQSQYHCVNPPIGAASFRVTRKPTEMSDERACYSFCMCPGGQVISCANTPGLLTSNGMSYSSHSLPFGNAAFLVPVTVEDIVEATEDTSPLAGIYYQEELEKKAFVAGGSDYALPAETLYEFLTGEDTPLPVLTSPHRVKKASLRAILPNFMTQTLKVSLPELLRKLGNPPQRDVVLYGIETRSSAPLQIKRSSENGESLSYKGLFPVGEGAGYAGGIVSSGVDGLKTAEEIIRRTAKKKIKHVVPR